MQVTPQNAGLQIEMRRLPGVPGVLRCSGGWLCQQRELTVLCTREPGLKFAVDGC